MLGLAPELHGEMLWPIGTIYDPFVERGLDALKYGTYAHAKFIFAGTPSGLTLCREAGAHQSFLTPLLGIGIPDLRYYEPAYAAELEVILCWALAQLADRDRGESVDQLFRGWMGWCQGERHAGYLDQLLPVEDRCTPAVTLLDGHPLALGWVGNVLQAPVRALGVTAFGESAALPDLYHKHRIDADAVIGAMAQLLFIR
jgi:pyruvate dehydrogenase complex dehydrogenase (E1) component